MVGTPVEEAFIASVEADEFVEEEASATEASLRSRVLRPRTLISFGLAIAVILIVFSRFNLDLGEVFHEIRHANPLYLLGAFAVYYGSFALRALRWQSLLGSAEVKPAPGKRFPGLAGFSVLYLLSWFVNCLVPAKLGDAYRAYALKQRSGASFGASLGTIFAERLADIVGLGALLVVSALLVFGRHMPSSITTWVYVAVGIGIALTTGLVLVLRVRHHLRSFVPERFREQYVRMEEGALGSFNRLPTLVTLTAIVWVLEGVRFYLVGLALHAGVSFSAALFVALLVSLLTAVPITPAGLGVVELGVVGTLALLNVVEHTAASMALLDRIVAYWSVLLVGGFVYLVSRRLWPAESRARSD